MASDSTSSSSPLTNPPSATHTPGGSETVLVVEDDRSVRDVVCGLLQGLGYEVMQASHGTAALVIAKAHAGPIDLLLADVVLPGLTGMELAAQMRRDRPALAVVLMSGYASSRSAVEAAGVTGRFLSKPFSPPELARVVRDAIDQTVAPASTDLARR